MFEHLWIFSPILANVQVFQKARNYEVSEIFWGFLAQYGPSWIVVGRKALCTAHLSSAWGTFFNYVDQFFFLVFWPPTYLLFLLNRWVLRLFESNIDIWRRTTYNSPFVNVVKEWPFGMHSSVRFHLKSHEDLTRKDATTPSLAK